MKTTVLFLLLITPSAFAGGNSKPIKQKWKNFKSSAGFSFAYPACWEIKPGYYDVDETKLAQASDIIASKTSDCGTQKSDLQGSLTFSFVAKRYKSSKEADTDYNAILNSLKIGRFANAGYKEIKIGKENAILFIEKPAENSLRLRVYLYCKNLDYVEMTGRYVQGPSSALVDYSKKVSNGDFEPGEPDKTVIESVRCTR
jgi:hypothetical protein